MKRRLKKIERQVVQAQATSDDFNKKYPTLANEIGASAFSNLFDILEALAARIVILEAAQKHTEDK